jgi:hypothetical protein
LYKIYSYTHHNLLCYAYSGDIQQGKKLPLDWKEDQGEVTDEDEGSETSKTKEKPKRVPLCKELSDLVSLVRCRFVSFLTSKEIRMLIYDTKIFIWLGLLSVYPYGQMIHA